jgi:hypothetical protein
VDYLFFDTNCFGTGPLSIDGTFWILVLKNLKFDSKIEKLCEWTEPIDVKKWECSLKFLTRSSFLFSVSPSVIFQGAAVACLIMQRRNAKLDENGIAAKGTGTNAQVADPHLFDVDPDPDPAYQNEGDPDLH